MPPQPAESRPRPAGWPVGSFSTYDKAQAAVDMLSDKQFDVSNITIVGLDLMEVERVTGRLTWPRVILNGIVSGSWLGLHHSWCGHGHSVFRRHRQRFLRHAGRSPRFLLRHPHRCRALRRVV